MANKVVFGLSNVHYAIVTETMSEGEITTSYGPVKKWPGAVNLSFSAEGNSKDFFADDRAYYHLSTNAGYTGSFESAMIPDDVLVEALGMKRVTEGGGIVEVADAESKYIALMFEVKGDASHRRYVFYRVSLTRPNVDAETINDDKEVKTQSIDITATQRPDDGLIKYKVEETDENYKNFFGSVIVPEVA